MNKRKEVFLITSDLTVREVMGKLETVGETLYVVDDDRKLIGSVSNGDVRKGILKSTGIDEGVTKIINYNPRYIYNNASIEEIREMLVDLGIDSLPIVTLDKKIIDIVDRKEAFKNISQKKTKYDNIKVFTLAGGFGTRLEPFTRILPKPLVPIGDKTIIEKIMDKFKACGFCNFVISLNYKAEMIKLYFSDPEVYGRYDSIEYITEDKPLGTIGSLSLAKEYLTESFFITNCDVIVEEDMGKILRYHKSNNNILTVIGCVKNSIIPYGVLNTDEKGNLIHIQEKPSYKNIINTGVYVAEPDIIRYITEGQKTDMNVLIEALLSENKKIGVYPVFEDQWFDIGQWAEFEKTRKVFENS